MRVLVCVGSHRRNGNTDQIASIVKQSLWRIAESKGEALHIETLHLAHQDIRACYGCRACFDKGEERCPLKDDMLMIKSKMAASDGLIIASPVYVNDVSGVVKNWIDRLAHVCHRPEFPDKCAYLITTVGDGPTNHALKTLRMALSCWGFHIVGQTGFKMGTLMNSEQVRARFAEDADEIAYTLFEAIRNRAYENPAFVSLMTFKIQQQVWQRARADSLDLAYWKGRGWTDAERKFYIPQRATGVKVGCARLAGALVARFVT